MSVDFNWCLTHELTDYRWIGTLFRYFRLHLRPMLYPWVLFSIPCSISHGSPTTLVALPLSRRISPLLNPFLVSRTCIWRMPKVVHIHNHTHRLWPGVIRVCRSTCIHFIHQGYSIQPPLVVPSIKLKRQSQQVLPPRPLSLPLFLLRLRTPMVPV